MAKGHVETYKSKQTYHSVIKDKIKRNRVESNRQELETIINDAKLVLPTEPRDSRNQLQMTVRHQS